MKKQSKLIAFVVVEIYNGEYVRPGCYINSVGLHRNRLAKTMSECTLSKVFYLI
jgi:hypothetical protein